MRGALLRIVTIALTVFNSVAADRIGSVQGKGKTGSDGWNVVFPREEIKPKFTFDNANGHGGTGSLIIEADQREGQTGCWTKSFPIAEGKYYRFQAFRRVHNVAAARRSARAIVKWQDAQGKSVPADQPWVSYDHRQKIPSAWSEFPRDGQTDTNGWTEVFGVYRAPQKA